MGRYCLRDHAQPLYSIRWNGQTRTPTLARGERAQPKITYRIDGDACLAGEGARTRPARVPTQNPADHVEPFIDTSDPRVIASSTRVTIPSGIFCPGDDVEVPIPLRVPADAPIGREHRVYLGFVIDGLTHAQPATSQAIYLPVWVGGPENALPAYSAGSYSIRWARQSDVPTLTRGQRAEPMVTFKLDGTACVAGEGAPTRKGRVTTQNPADHVEPFLNADDPRVLSDRTRVTIPPGVYCPGDEITVPIPLRVPADAPLGERKVYLGFVIEGLTHAQPASSQGIYLPVVVSG